MKTIGRIAENLLARAVDDHGARSLAHLTVVVPTAQSGRRLRLALAKAAGGAVVPPEVVLPDQLLVRPDDPRLATRSEELLAMHEALGGKDVTLDVAARYLDLRHILAEKAVSFAEVAAKCEIDRDLWTELAALEERYYAALGRFGKRDRIVLMKEGRPRGEVIYLNDPTTLPTCSLGPGQSPRSTTESSNPTPPPHPPTPCATPASEAELVAEYFAAVKSTEALPALCVADPELFPEIVSAFEAKGMKVHDPSRTRFITSSLGRLVSELVALERTGSYQVFSSFVRSGDARRWLKSELKLDDDKLTAALIDLDNRQAEFLPEKLGDIAPKTSGTLRAIFEFVQVQLRKRGVRGMLFSIFKEKKLDDADPSSREFAAAAECINAVFDEVGCAPATLYHDLLARRIDEAEFSLEPDEGEVILTDGWLELPFLDADELVIAGFQEGRVPESVVGHPFLPDSLRHELGLTDNSSRTTRDRAILSLASEAIGLITFHSVDAKGDVLKPSRLLFENCDDAELLRRVKSFYGVKAGTGEVFAPEIPPGWKLKLPIPPERHRPAKLSPTRLDGYLRCPFTYYLREKDILGDKRMDDRAEELESWEYGNLAHDALEKFGLSDLRDSADAGRIRSFLEERVDAQLVERFGTAIPAIVAMQGESVKRRLAHFAAVQAAWRDEGWKIEAVERKLAVEYDGVRFHGKCDRVDRNEKTGEWCVIDYKTWDSAEKAASFKRHRDGSVEWLSLQLPIYCAMLDADPSPEFAEAKLDVISSCYCVLGKTVDEVVFTPRMNGRGNVEAAEAKVRELLERIERGIFWPPGAKDEWKWDYADWLGDDPAKSVDEKWLADQARRLEGVER